MLFFKKNLESHWLTNVQNPNYECTFNWASQAELRVNSMQAPYWKILTLKKWAIY